MNFTVRICLALGLAAMMGGEVCARQPPPPPHHYGKTARHLPQGMVWCSRCDGSGRAPRGFFGITTKKCPDCAGLGMRQLPRSKYAQPPRRAPLSPREIEYRKPAPPPPPAVRHNPPPGPKRPSGAQPGGYRGGEKLPPPPPHRH